MKKCRQAVWRVGPLPPDIQRKTPNAWGLFDIDPRPAANKNEPLATGFAVRSDSVHRKRHRTNPIFSPDPEAWDAAPRLRAHL